MQVEFFEVDSGSGFSRGSDPDTSELHPDPHKGTLYTRTIRTHQKSEIGAVENSRKFDNNFN